MFSALSDTLMNIGLSLIGIAVIGFIIYFLRKGNYSFLTHEKEVKEGKNLKNKVNGVFFGKIYNPNYENNHRYVFKSEYEEGNIMIVGGTGSGKTASSVINTLFFWSGSCLVTDIKGELERKAKRFRRRIKRFDFGKSDYTYDVLESLRNAENKVLEARLISSTVLPTRLEEKDPFWTESAQSLFTACLLFWQDDDFPTICKKILELTPEELIDKLVSEGSQEVKYLVNDLSQIDIKVKSNIKFNLSKEISLYATDEDIIKSLSKSDNNISVDDLEKGYDIFLRIEEYKIDDYKKLLSLIISQFSKSFEKRKENSVHPILFLIDEFPRLGKMVTIKNSLSTLRSKNVQICLILQSLAQLDMIYGEVERKVICDCCDYKLILKATDAETQEYFSRLVGTHNIRIPIRTISSNTTNGSTKTNGRNNSTTYANDGFRDSYNSGRSYSTAYNQQMSFGESIGETIKEERIIKPEHFAYLGEYPVLFTPTQAVRIIKTFYFREFASDEQIEELGAYLDKETAFKEDEELRIKVDSNKNILELRDKLKQALNGENEDLQKEYAEKLRNERAFIMESYERGHDYFDNLIDEKEYNVLCNDELWNIRKEIVLYKKENDKDGKSLNFKYEELLKELKENYEVEKEKIIQGDQEEPKEEKVILKKVVNSEQTTFDVIEKI